MNACSVARTQFVSARMEALPAPAKWDTRATVLVVKVKLDSGHFAVSSLLCFKLIECSQDAKL